MQSDKAIRWLRWIAHDRNVYVEHARNTGEKAIGHWKCDGFVKSQKLVLEFHGNL